MCGVIWNEAPESNSHMCNNCSREFVESTSPSSCDLEFSTMFASKLCELVFPASTFNRLQSFLRCMDSPQCQQFPLFRILDFDLE